MGRIRGAMVLVLLLGWSAVPDSTAEEPKKKPANRLAKESSPYLLQHAHNPVDWFPWGEEAFAKAKKEGKLVFLSIGYSSCHWCHVMEKESFANAEVAKLMNEWFICIKVDREERPDVDHIYMTALHVMRQRGGWPLSMFLTADGKPIVGGTYWPPDDKEIDGEKVHGFKSILKLLHDFHEKQPKDIETQADKFASATTTALAGIGRGINLVDLDRDLVKATLEGIQEEFDKTHGGFGSPASGFRGTKFPTPPYLTFLQYEAGRTKSAELKSMLTITLDAMARGGIYDHLGGGFHRYSTERTWTVPHFEKMLYDNAQLMEIYGRAYQTSKNPFYRRVMEQTLAFLNREMVNPEGGFYSALDADSEGEEGRFYVWTAKDLESVLGTKADVDFIKQVFSNDGTPNFESSYYILRLPKPLAEIAQDMKLTAAELDKRLEPLRQKLFEARAKRDRPFLDKKVLTAWNGQMIAGYAVAGQVLENKAYVDQAIQSANFVLQNLRTPKGRLLRSYGARPGEKSTARLNGYLDDYAFFVHGLLALNEATNDKKWLDEAKTLTDKSIELFQDKERGGFFFTSHDHEKLFARAKDQYDGAQPSANSVAARNLVRLWIKTGDEKYGTLAEKSFRTFASQLKTSPTSMATMAEALAMYLDVKEKAPKKDRPKNDSQGNNDPFHKDNSLPEKPAPEKAITKWADYVKSLVKISFEAENPKRDGRQKVKLNLTIEKGWWLYANHSGGREGLDSWKVLVEIKNGAIPGDIKIEYPPGKLVSDKEVGEYRIYEGNVTISAQVRRSEDKAPLELRIRLIPMDGRMCGPPVWSTLSVP